MDGACFKSGKFWIIRIDPGEDVLNCIRKFVLERGIEQAMVVNGYGTFSKVSLHWVTHNRFPTDNRFEEWEGGIELMGMSGLIIEGEPHIHFTASTPEGAFGGHLEEGCICYVLCEVVIMELEGGKMRRERAAIAKDDLGRSAIGPRLVFQREE
jgi:predicted DNA-binding protein with PD1-like motif